MNANENQYFDIYRIKQVSINMVSNMGRAIHKKEKLDLLKLNLDGTYNYVKKSAESAVYQHRKKVKHPMFSCLLTATVFHSYLAVFFLSSGKNFSRHIVIKSYRQD